MSKKIYLIRHSKAEERANTPMLPDKNRNLISKGIMDAAKMGNLLKEKGAKIDLIISSDANRAFQTAKAIAEQLKYDVDAIQLNDELYSGGARAYLACLNSIDEKFKNVIFVGHNPDISYFGEYLTRDSVGPQLSTSSCLVLEFEKLPWVEIGSKSGSFVERYDKEDL